MMKSSELRVESITARAGVFRDVRDAPPGGLGTSAGMPGNLLAIGAALTDITNVRAQRAQFA